MKTDKSTLPVYLTLYKIEIYDGLGLYCDKLTLKDIRTFYHIFKLSTECVVGKF